VFSTFCLFLVFYSYTVFCGTVFASSCLDLCFALFSRYLSPGNIRAGLVVALFAFVFVLFVFVFAIDFIFALCLCVVLVVFAFSHYLSRVHFPCLSCPCIDCLHFIFSIYASRLYKTRRDKTSLPSSPFIHSYSFLLFKICPCLFHPLILLHSSTKANQPCLMRRLTRCVIQTLACLVFCIALSSLVMLSWTLSLFLILLLVFIAVGFGGGGGVAERR
jgi:hypothetical protein